jgi:hypothetical protein
MLEKRRNLMKLWIDDVRPAPEGYVWCKTVDDAKVTILKMEQQQFMFLEQARYEINHYDLCGYRAALDMASRREIELIDIDHDAGDYGPPDYIKVLDWLEETGRNYPIKIHSMNAVGVANMRAIIQRNGWREVF